MTYPLLLTRRSLSVGGLSGRLSVPVLPPVRLLARRTFVQAAPFDTGFLDIDEESGARTPTITYWERSDTVEPDIIQVVEVPAETWWQPTVTLEANHNEVWGRFEFQFAARAPGDTRTRLVGFSFNGLLLGIYENDGDLELTDEAAINVRAPGAGGTGEAWRVVDFQVASASAVGGDDGVLRVWLDGATTPAAEITTHARHIRGCEVQFGLGSVGSAATMRLAHLALFDGDFRSERPVSEGWADTAPFRKYTAPVSAIEIQPDTPRVGDGAVAGTKIASLTRTGGAGDGTWQLTGALAAIAEIVGTEVRLTSTVDVGNHDGTSGSVDYTGDSAGGDPAAVSVTLSVVDAATDLILLARAGGGAVTGTLDASSPFVRMRLVSPNTPLISGKFMPAGGSAEVEDKGGTFTRAGAEEVANADDIAIIYVDSLGGGDEVGTLRWAATTDTDNNGNDISSAKVVYVLFSISGHCELGGALLFNRGNRRFCGQTCPVDRNGRAGFIIHGASGWNIKPRRVRASHLIIEHLSFSDGRIPYRNDGSINDSAEPPYGNLDFYEKGRGGYHDILIQNCAFVFGLDEAVGINSDEGCSSNLTFTHCVFGPPMFNDVANKRGYNCLMSTGSRRNEMHANWWVGGRTRNPWIQSWSDLVYTNNFLYDCTEGVYTKTPKYHQYDKSIWYPVGRYILACGNEGVDGPMFNFNRRPKMVFTARIQSYWTATHLFNRDNIVAGGDGDQYSTTRDFWKIYSDTITIDMCRPPVPVEDVRDYVIPHAGPHPAHQDSVMELLRDRWEGRGQLVWTMRGNGPVRDPSEWPGQNLVETRETPTPPSEPHLPGIRGLTRMEEWLEDLHVAAGGHPYRAFGRRRRFPLGGVVTIETDGSVTFEPEDMASGQSGTVEVRRADGTTVSVTCTVS